MGHPDYLPNPIRFQNRFACMLEMSKNQIIEAVVREVQSHSPNALKALWTGPCLPEEPVMLAWFHLNQDVLHTSTGRPTELFHVVRSYRDQLSDVILFFDSPDLSLIKANKPTLIPDLTDILGDLPHEYTF